MSLVLLESEDCEATGRPGHRSLVFESRFRKVGGPVGVRDGFWMGGGLVDAGWGDGGRCFSAPGEDGRVLGPCLSKENMFICDLYSNPNERLQPILQELRGEYRMNEAVWETYLAATGEGVLFGAGLGAGEGERLRPRVEDGEAGRCPWGNGNCLSFYNATHKKDRNGEIIKYLN